MNRATGTLGFQIGFWLSLILLATTIGCWDGGSESQSSTYFCRLEKTGVYPLHGYSYGLAVSGNRAAIMNEAEMGGPATLHIVDISTPGAPTRFGVRTFTDSTLINALTLSGTSAYLLLRQYDNASAAWQSTLEAIDLTDKRLPMKKLTTVADGYTYGFVLHKQWGYLLGDAGVAVVNMDTFATTPVPNSSSCCYMRIADGRAYTSGGLKALDVFDIQSPGAPVLMGSFDIPAALDGYAHDLAVFGSTAVLAWGGSGVVVLDVGRPEKITQLSRYATIDWAEGVAADGNGAYLADGDGGLLVVGKSASREAGQAEICPVDGYASDVIIWANHVFVSVNDKGFIIYETASSTTR